MRRHQRLDRATAGFIGSATVKDLFGWMAFFVAMDNPTSSAVTRDLLGWAPEGPGLLADLRDAGYFG